MGDLGATLIKELNCETAFTIGGIGISESVVVTWIMMAVVLVVSLIVTHGLKVEHPGRGQLLLESAVTWLQGIGEGISLKLAADGFDIAIGDLDFQQEKAEGVIKKIEDFIEYLNTKFQL